MVPSSSSKTMFLSILDQEVWQNSLTVFNRKVERKVNVEEFKEELRDKVMEFGEVILIETAGLDKVAREYLLNKMIHIRETRPNISPSSGKNSSSLKRKKESKKFKTKMSKKNIKYYS